MSKRCICGRSRRYPVCDGSHTSLHWSCELTTRPTATWCFVAAPRNENFALRLASTFDGIALADTLTPVDVEHLVLLCDGADIDALKRRIRHVHARRRIAIALGAPADLIARALPDFSVYGAPAREALEQWREVRAHLVAIDAEGDTSPAPRARPLKRAFLSHAVQDEAALAPVVDFLRAHYRAQLFVCADSIDAGSEWHRAIRDELHACEQVLFALSSASIASTFCAFEIGYAAAAGKPLSLISLDGAAPPAYVQHLHMLDVPRRLRARPWLNHRDALLEITLELLTADP